MLSPQCARVPPLLFFFRTLCALTLALSLICAHPTSVNAFLIVVGLRCVCLRAGTVHQSAMQHEATECVFCTDCLACRGRGWVDASGG